MKTILYDIKYKSKILIINNFLVTEIVVFHAEKMFGYYASIIVYIIVYGKRMGI